MMSVWYCSRRYCLSLASFSILLLLKRITTRRISIVANETTMALINAFTSVTDFPK
ncbi:MAG: hypothetical protein BWY93_02333 [Euryarchaeota archaeon ADurb.BinA087]|nr:MAG: hypothetical protein BWY93_02333 [Euryarchaeota archaeon ADurb.BinA087]